MFFQQCFLEALLDWHYPTHNLFAGPINQHFNALHVAQMAGFNLISALIEIKNISRCTLLPADSDVMTTMNLEVEREVH